MSSENQQGAGSAAWGAARKAFLYGQGHISGESKNDTKKDCGEEESKHEAERQGDEAEAVMPDLTQTRRYVHKIPEFLRLEALLLKASNKDELENL